jgi:hypothetical protein
MIAAAFFVALGAFLMWLGWRHWRFRKQETISVLEAAILHVTGEKPPPRTKGDRILSVVHTILCFLLGPFFMLVGIAAGLDALGFL